MQTLERIEPQVRELSKADQKALRDWLGRTLEDQLDFTDEIATKI